MKNLRSEQKIMKNWKGDLSLPLVSIGCLAYNHEKYIEDALGGFLIQETDFPFEILVHDDASMDRTADIIREYEAIYPNLIKPIYQTENQFSKKDGTTGRIQRGRAKGKYYAVCEGDDYWTDPLKLRKQVDFLEANPQCSICFHPVIVKHEDKSRHDYIFPHPQTHPFVYQNQFTELKHLIQANYIQTNSVMYRWCLKDEQSEDIIPRDILPKDWFYHLLHAEKGKIGFLNEVMAVYRRHSGSIWWESGRNHDKFLLQNGMKHLACYQAIEQRWPEKITPDCRETTTRFAADVLRVFIKTHNTDGQDNLKQRFPEYYDRGVTYLLSLCVSLVDEFQSEKNRNASLTQENTALKARVESLTRKPHPACAKPGKKHSLSTPSGSAADCPGPPVSIIIPLFNKIEFTQKCLEALFQNTPDELYELILIDNASTDGTKAFLQTLTKKNITLITNGTNRGFAKACNQGAHIASCEYLVFLNNDTEPLQNWMEPLIEIARGDDSVAAVGSKLLYPDMTIQHAGVIIVNDKAGNDPLQARNNHVNKPATTPEANTPRLYQALTAACVLIKKKAFMAVGGFDEGYWNGYEDVDLCFKLRNEGALVYQPASVVIHHESKSGPERFARVRENIDRLHRKWIDKITPDLILNPDGSATCTEANKISPYRIPLSSQPARSAQEHLVSIVVLTYNQLDYTKQCISSLETCTREPYEIIFVDNGSSDGTREYLQEYAKKYDHIRLILNDENKGFAGGNNQGIAQAKGNYIVLLNNDVVVTRCWLERLISRAELSPDIGMVGPMSNSVSGPQLVPTVSYRDNNIQAMHEFAGNFAVANSGKVTENMRLVGFCLLIKKEVFDVIGGLDENYISGNFEDDDLCLRSFIAGYKNIIAHDVFIHHYGSMTFKGNAIDYRATMNTNRRYFADKWKDIVEVTGNQYTVRLTRDKQIKKLLGWGEERFSRGNIRSAVKIFERVLRVDRTNAQALNNLGVIQWQIGDMISAMRTFQIALSHNPADPDALANLVQAATETGRFDLVETRLVEALKQAQPANPDITRLIDKIADEATCDRPAVEISHGTPG